MNKRIYILYSILFLSFVFMFKLTYGASKVEVVEKGFYKLPHSIGSWVGEDHTFSDEVYEELRADENLYRIYKRPDGSELGLYIGYYGTARGGHPDHVPTGCYPGSGWGIDSNLPHDIATSDGAYSITANSLYVIKEDKSQQTFYWQQNFLGRASNSGWNQNFEKMKTRLLYGKNDGALIRVNSMVQNSREETVAFQTDFIQLLLPMLKDVWPVEKVGGKE